MARRLGKSGPSKHTWRIIGLGAEGPLSDLQEKLTLFGQFVGDWDIVESRYPRPDGTEVKRRGELHFGWILGGRAIQDVWMMQDKDTHVALPVGTTVRFYDPRIDAWQSIWISPVQGVVQTFVARKVGDEIVLEGKTKEGYPEKWIFSQITPNSFRWHAEETHDNGKTWMLTEEMQIQRRRTET
ncbi:MAG: hypothetical protein HYU39_04925 [Thaumarchaeota archaeon]|nr:hypothetical protein [Nitrososphaerota archaeon]